MKLKFRQDPLPRHGFEHVFTHELRVPLRRRREGARREGGTQREIPADAAPDRALGYELVGLALSGGGIRSAVTNLGFLQALAKGGELARCDYLSTVSGGGYIGCCLTSLLTNPTASVSGQSFPFSFNGREENAAVKRLRAHGNYLAPSHGLLAVGTWQMVSAYLLGLLFNLTMVFLVVGAAATVGIWLCAKYVELMRLPGMTAFLDWARVPFDPSDHRRSEFRLLLMPALAAVGVWALAGLAYMLFLSRKALSTSRRAWLVHAGGWLIRLAAVFVAVAAVSRLFHFLHPRTTHEYLGMSPEEHRRLMRVLKWVYGAVAAVSGVPLLRPRDILERVRAGFAPYVLTLASGAFAVCFVVGVTYLAWRVKDDLPLLLALAAFTLVLGVLVDANRVSMFYFYRDRLSEAFLFRLPEDAPDGAGSTAGSGTTPARDDAGMDSGASPQTRTQMVPTDGLPLHLSLEPWPVAERARRTRPPGLGTASAGAKPPGAPRAVYYPLINATVNVPGRKRPDQLHRPADYFLFSPDWCGSDVTGYVESSRFERGQLTLADAMAVSGAAANPQLGFRSNPFLAFVLAVFNARLGLWIENPGYYPRFGPRKYRVRFWPWYLLLELVSKADEKRAYVNVSDGGHVDNLGLYELLRRRCRTIIVSDVSSDQDHGYEDLAGVIRRARIDMGIQVEIDCSKLEPDPATGLAPTHVVEGTISYPEGDKDDPARLYLTKTTVTAKDPVDVKERRRSTKTFPNETTLDQFFDEAQFEEYRELGYRAGKEMCVVIANRGRTMEAKAADSDM